MPAPLVPHGSWNPQPIRRGRPPPYRGASFRLPAQTTRTAYDRSGDHNVSTHQADRPETRVHTVAEYRRRRLFTAVQGFIKERLADPRLCPAVIAAAHHISTRSLHRLFRSQGCTVSSCIRLQRLDRARRDLADPQLAGRTIQAIAAAWGFPRASDFTRSFRATYGTPPQNFRDRALCDLLTGSDAPCQSLA
ncbi:helix-turn-helix domain-containing protein [Streptomyces sp. A73]|nr:helix-turn-helix domain-containing protein [Streptomyces sp. A73]